MEKKEGDWYCVGCPNDKHGNALNFAKRSNCIRCGKERPLKQHKPEELHSTRNRKHVPFLKGDWLCVACNDHQFATNLQCRKCKASRPVKDGDSDGLECVVCFSNVRNVGFFHNDEAHVCCCKECAAKLKECPMCREQNFKIINVYF